MHLVLGCALPFIQDVTKDDTRIGRGNFDGGLDVDEVVRPDVLCWWALDNFKISQRRKLNCQILQCFCSLVDQEYVKNNVKLMDLG